MIDNKYQAVLVTGAGSGIGHGCAQLLAANGYTVFAGLHTSKPSAIETVADDRIIPLIFDIRCDESIRAAVVTITQTGYPLLGVVNCAGVSLPGPLQHLESSAVLDLFNVNVVGQLRVVQACLPLLMEKGGKIIMIGSTSGSIPGVFTGAYSASKFALSVLSAVLRAELADSGITLCMVDPGMIKTPFWQQTLKRANAVLDQRTAQTHTPLDVAFAGWVEDVSEMVNHATDPQQVAEQVLRALKARRTPFRYVPGLKAKLKLLVWQCLPPPAKDAIIRRPLRTKRIKNPPSD